MALKGVCRHFRGDRPCKYYWVDRSHECENCSHFSQIKERILLIKLDALGDVIRATPLIEGFKKKYPNSHITWLVGESSFGIIKNTPNVDRVLNYCPDSVLALKSQSFDILLNLDKAAHTSALAMQISADEKKGYGLDENGTVFPFNKGAEYHYEICLDNWGKKTANTKTYQEMIFDMAGLDYNREEYNIRLPDSAFNFASEFLKEKNILSKDFAVGLNTGCGPVYPHKKWILANYARLIDMLVTKLNAKILLFGAESEVMQNKWLCDNSNYKANIIDTTNSLDLAQFAALISSCNVLVTGDTVGMHIGIALKRPVVALFGPTPASEIDMYGNGVKLVAKVDCINCYDQFPCNRTPNCMETITPEEVFAAVESLNK